MFWLLLSFYPWTFELWYENLNRDIFKNIYISVEQQMKIVEVITDLWIPNYSDLINKSKTYFTTKWNKEVLDLFNKYDNFLSKNLVVLHFFATRNNIYTNPMNGKWLFQTNIKKIGDENVYKNSRDVDENDISIQLWDYLYDIDSKYKTFETDLYWDKWFSLQYNIKKVFDKFKINYTDAELYDFNELYKTWKVSQNLNNLYIKNKETFTAIWIMEVNDFNKIINIIVISIIWEIETKWMWVDLFKNWYAEKYLNYIWDDKTSVILINIQ